MSLLSVLLILVIVGVAMYLIKANVPAPYSWVLLVICGIVLLVFVMQVLGLDLGNVRIGSS